MSDRQCKNCEYADRNWEICDIAEDREGEWYCNNPLAVLLDNLEYARNLEKDGARLQAELETANAKIENQRTEIKGLKEVIEPMRFNLKEIRSALGDRGAELEAAKKDKERLDWLDNNRIELIEKGWMMIRPGERCKILLDNEMSARQIIDEAMK